MIATTILEFQPFAVIGIFNFLAVPIRNVPNQSGMSPIFALINGRFFVNWSCLATHYGLQLISMSSNITKSVFPIVGDEISRIRVFAEMWPSMFWLNDR